MRLRRVCLCLCVRGRRPVKTPGRPGLPPLDEATRLADWLSGPRGRLLRRAQVALRKRVLEIGCGHGNVTRELARRAESAEGLVVGLDRDSLPAATAGLFTGPLVEGEASALPFADGCFDLALCQNALLWVEDLDGVMREAARVLAPGGVLIALEPDYGGAMEHPPGIALKDLWLKGLRAVGADPEVGRKIRGAAHRAGLRTRVELQNVPGEATPEGARLLAGLPLDSEDLRRARAVIRELERRRCDPQVFVHVPYVLVEAHKDT